MIPVSIILFVHSRNFKTIRLRVENGRSEGGDFSTDRDDLSSHIDINLIESTNEDGDIDSVKNDRFDEIKSSEKKT